jgi:hypothetical protein
MFAQIKVSREHRTVVIFGQGRLEIGGGDLVWASLGPHHYVKRLLLKRNTVPRTNIALALLRPATVVVVRDMQELMQTPTLTFKA